MGENSIRQRTKRSAGAAFAIASAVVLFLSPGANASGERLAFDVFLENRPIGSHEVVLNQVDNQTTVEINADFKVKLLFVTAFRYQHDNLEVWRDNCLENIDATTVVNGETFKVEGDKSNEGCARTFAYWDRSLLESAQLLNSQTGAFVATTLTELGSGDLTIGGEELEVDRYRLTGEEIDITLAYARDSSGNEEWVGLSSKVGGGRTLKYVRTPETFDLSGSAP